MRAPKAAPIAYNLHLGDSDEHVASVPRYFCLFSGVGLADICLHVLKRPAQAVSLPYEDGH
jgi:hypothetical protein